MYQPIQDPPSPTSTGSAHEAVYRALRGRIMFGEVPPAQALTIRGIAGEFGVSMTPAREAVRRLAAEGALTLSSSGRISTPELSGDRVEELGALRALLEVELASRALPRAHAALVTRLQTINQSIGLEAERGNASGYIRRNLEFHRTLYLRAQAPAMLAMTETVWLQLGPTMGQLYSQRSRDFFPFYHRQIIAALNEGDEPGLRLAIRMDVTRGLRMLNG